MKQLLLILSILLTCTAAQAQRYRLVADSSFKYNSEQEGYELDEVNEYKYNEGSEWTTPDGKYFYFDTMYHYRVYNGDKGLMYKHARVYHNNKQVQKEIWYEQFPLRRNRKPIPVDYDSLMLYSAYEYYENGAYVPVRVDSFVYDELGRIIEKYVLTTTTELPLMVPNRYCESYPDGEYKLYLWEHTIYKYHQGNCVAKIIMAYTPKGDVHHQTNVRHVYHKDVRKSTDSVEKDRWSTHRVLKQYRKSKVVGVELQEYEKDEECTHRSKFWIKGVVKNGIVKTSYWTKDKGDVKLLYYTIEDADDSDGFRVKSVFKKYYADGSVQHHQALWYSYTEFGFFKEKQIAYMYNQHYSSNEEKSTTYSKTTYTYEEY